MICQCCGEETERRSSRQMFCADCAKPQKMERQGWRLLEKRFGLTKEAYEQLLEKQNGGCAICGEACATGDRLAVDHDHETGEVRGLLCRKHNVGLGMFNDDVDLLLAALLYLMSED